MTQPKVQTPESVIESVRAALWDAHYRKGLSAEYARHADADLTNLAAEIAQLREQRDSLREALESVQNCGSNACGQCKKVARGAIQRLRNGR